MIEEAMIILDEALQRCQVYAYKDWPAQQVEELIIKVKTELSKQ